MNTQNSRTLLFSIDGLGLIASGLCLVHCLLLPVILSLIPLGLVESGEETPWMHATLVGVAAVIASFALARGYLRHRQKHVVIAGALGLVLMTLSLVLPHEVEILLISTGGILLMLAHFGNWRLSQVGCCHEDALGQTHCSR